MYQTFNLVGHSKMISALDIHGRLVVSGSRDNAVKVWDIQKKRGVTFEVQRGHINWITQVMVWDESSVLSASADRTIRYYDLPQLESDEEYNGIVMRGHTQGVNQIKRLNNSYTRVVSSSMDGTTRIWDVTSGVCTGEFGDHDGIGISRIAMNSNYLMSFSD
jgi:F-box and WD-40 domain protein CDC4